MCKDAGVGSLLNNSDAVRKNSKYGGLQRYSADREIT